MVKKSTSQKTYQELAADLAEIIDWFESDNVDLDQAIIKYEAATNLLKQMETYLKTAQNTITKISAQTGN